MIVKDFYKTRQDGVNLYRTYSSSGFKILQTDTGFLYDDAIDVETSAHTYEETNEPIETTVMTAQEALDTIFGGTDDTVHTEPSA